MGENDDGEIDWDQPARLFLRSTWTSGPKGGFSGPVKAEGVLLDVVGAYRALNERDRARARIVIVGGFHVDGNEIDELAARKD